MQKFHFKYAIENYKLSQVQYTKLKFIYFCVANFDSKIFANAKAPNSSIKYFIPAN